MCLQDGSVFADFDLDSDEHVYLARISFDGYGCCETGAEVTHLSLCESRTLGEAVEGNDVNRDDIREILCRYFTHNQDIIGREALAAHELIVP